MKVSFELLKQVCTKFDEIGKLLSEIHSQRTISNKELRQETGVYNVRELMDVLPEFTRHTINRAVGGLKPDGVVGQFPVWKKERLDEIRNAINLLPHSSTAAKEQWESIGLITTRSACKRFGVSFATWRKMTERGILPKPTHPYKARKLYTVQEAEEIANKIKSNENPGEGWLSRVQVAEALKVVESTIGVWSRKWKIGTEFKGLVRSRIWFTQQDVDKLKLIQGSGTILDNPVKDHPGSSTAC